MKRTEAMFYKKWSGEIVCQLCPHSCILIDGAVGKCGVRKSIEDILITTNYGKIVAQNVDPIEKKPLFHFWPGSRVYSIAAPGCNLHCKFCQNWELSQKPDAESHTIEPEAIVENALKTNCHGIAYTYTEPTVFYEFAYDTAKLAKKAGLFNVWVSNGMINNEPIKKISKLIDAVNIDIKGNSKFYRRYAGGVGIEPVLNAVKEFKKHGVWVEITNLLIPEINDSNEDIQQIVDFIAEVDERIPFHISRFHPHHKMKDAKPTPIKTINAAIKLAKEQLEYVYAGNVPGHETESTYCIDCGEPVIKRRGLRVRETHIKNNSCASCGAKIHMVGKIIKPLE
ncbi:MAG: AmmeMemoRadiSam system radical SAM enzyme [Candidatus Altiarchaeota archaeon]|nr:AmmeMemoRadiSam system radical SAM enzyme [Candidatus Altiarchaeota archaeon]